MMAERKLPRTIQRALILIAAQCMQPEGEIALAVQICKSIFQECGLPVFFHIRMKKNVNHRLHTVDVFSFPTAVK
jgi:hypothetical protein